MPEFRETVFRPASGGGVAFVIPTLYTPHTRQSRALRARTERETESMTTTTARTEQSVQSAGQVEIRSIDYVPVSERDGKPWHLGPVWFQGNAQLSTLAVGAIGVSIGLNLIWALIAIVTGTLIGTLFLAFPSAQGPKLGLPELIHTGLRWATWLFIIVYGVFTIGALFTVGAPHGAFDLGKWDGGLFLVQFGVVVSYQLTWAPYVSEYSRYLPPET